MNPKSKSRGLQPWRPVLITLAAVFLLPMAARPVHCQSFRVGPIAQKNAVLQPGIEITYGDSLRFPRQLRFSFAYTTSRGAAAFGSRGLVEDRFLVGSGWYFRPRRLINPYAQLEAGWTRFDRENPDIFKLLDNDAFLASALVGIEIQLLETGLSLQGDAGYSIFHSSTVYPFVASMGIFYTL